MSVTDGDRKRARAILAESTFGIQVNQAMAVPRIAQALADERERARAPFLTLADKLDDQNDPMWWSPLLAERIRRATRDQP